MSPAELSSIVAELWIAIHQLAGYPVPERDPPVQLVALATLQQMVCGQPCPVRGVFIPGKGVFVDEQRDLRSDVFSRSVLLHELVHHAQDLSGRFAHAGSPCRQRQAKEREAYAIQQRYLAQMGVARRFVAEDAVAAICRDTDAAMDEAVSR